MCVLRLRYVNFHTHTYIHVIHTREKKRGRKESAESLRLKIVTKVETQWHWGMWGLKDSGECRVCDSGECGILVTVGSLWQWGFGYSASGWLCLWGKYIGVTTLWGAIHLEIVVADVIKWLEWALMQSDWCLYWAMPRMETCREKAHCSDCEAN